MSWKFKPSEKVINKKSLSTGVIHSHAHSIGNDRFYWVFYDYSFSGAEITAETDLEHVNTTLPAGTNIYQQQTKKCECGAWATSFPDFHSSWCPLYIK